MSTLLSNIIAATIFATLGIVLFIVGFLVIDRLTPGSLWKELLDDQNTAVAILMSGIAIALAIIIAAAVT